MQEKIVDVGFLYPIIDGKIYVLERRVLPYRELYGPIISGLADENGDFISGAGDESAVVGKFYEDVLGVSEYSRDDVSNVFKTGVITDFGRDRTINCHFYLAMFSSDNFDFSTSLTKGLKPLTEIDEEFLYPLAKASLFGLQRILERGGVRGLDVYFSLKLEEQIPEFNEEEISEVMQDKATSVAGLVVVRL